MPARRRNCRRDGAPSSPNDPSRPEQIASYAFDDSYGLCLSHWSLRANTGSHLRRLVDCGAMSDSLAFGWPTSVCYKVSHNGGYN
jgi:hypothetical protein